MNVSLTLLLICWTSAFVAGQDSRIVGGTETNIQYHKHLVQLRYKGNWKCGGALLSTKHVVTAAHCVDDDPNKPRLFSIRAGSSSRNTGGLIRQAVTIWMHPKYNPAISVDYDVAVLKLLNPAKGKFIAPIPLATSRALAGQTVQAAGWGSTDHDHIYYPDIVREVTVNVVQLKDCNATWGYGLTPRMMCAFTPGKGVCFGDSGGSLTRNGKLYGISSFINRCGSDSIPSVFTDVVTVRPFITSKLKL